jgi:hypothetical protein
VRLAVNRESFNGQPKEAADQPNIFVARSISPQVASQAKIPPPR